MPLEPKSITEKTALYLAVLAGLAVLGILIAVAAVAIAAAVLRAGSSAGFGALGIVIGAAIIGYPLGVICGIVLVNKLLKLPGSLGLGVAGSLLGPAVILVLLEPAGLNTNPTLMLSSYLISSPVLGTVGYVLGGWLGWMKRTP